MGNDVRPERLFGTVGVPAEMWKHGPDPCTGEACMCSHRYDPSQSLRPKADQPKHGPNPSRMGSTAAELLRLQRAIGNAAVAGLLEEERSPVHDVIRTGDTPLAGIRGEMDARLGADFSDVRTHNDTAADHSTASVQLHACTQPRVQRVLIAGINVNKQTNMPTWDQNNITYHINLTTDTYHVTAENAPKPKGGGTMKIQYFFKRPKLTCESTNPTGNESGGNKKSKKRFGDLPPNVQNYVQTNYSALIG